MKVGTSFTFDGYSLYLDLNVELGSKAVIANDPGDSRDEEPDLIEVEAVHILSPANITELLKEEVFNKIIAELREDHSWR